MSSEFDEAFPTLARAKARRISLESILGQSMARPKDGCLNDLRKWRIGLSKIVGIYRSSKRKVMGVIVGGPGEEELGHAVARHMKTHPIVLSGKTTIRQLLGIIKRCAFFLTNDTGPMHIAGALGVPLVAVFGSTDPDHTAPSPETGTIVRAPVTCSPCLLRHCPIDHRCMEGGNCR